MLKVLIVDDEPAALRSLRYLIPWEEHGFSVSAEAGSGERALELYSEQGFDLIITDIKMPGMDGLQLAAEVKKRRDTPIFIVSGFHEFEYARQGIQLGVKDYLLKPVDAGELLTCLDNVRRELERKALLDKTLYRGLPALREQAAEQWAKGNCEPARQLTELKAWPWREESSFCVLAIELNGMSGNPADAAGDVAGASSEGERDVRLRCFSVRNIVDEQSGEYGLTFQESGERRVVLIYRLHEQIASERQLAAWAERLHRDIKQYTKENVFIAVGAACSDPEGVSQSYESALSASRYRHLADEKRPVVTAEELLRANEGSVSLVRKAEKIIGERFRENVELKRVAQEMYVNPNYLGQQFKAVTGLSFKDYVLELRMETAKELLLYTDKKVYEIAEEVGIKDLDWFYKRFKAYAGISANEFRAAAAAASVPPDS